MPAFNKINNFKEQIGLKLIDLNTDTLKVYLTNTAPVATDTIFGTPAEIAAGGGYTAGGADITGVWSENPAGTGELTGTDVVWTGSGGGFGPFQYVVLYDDTSAAKHLIGWWDYGSPVTIIAGETFTVDFAATILTIV